MFQLQAELDVPAARSPPCSAAAVCGDGCDGLAASATIANHALSALPARFGYGIRPYRANRRVPVLPTTIPNAASRLTAPTAAGG